MLWDRVYPHFYIPISCESQLKDLKAFLFREAFRYSIASRYSKSPLFFPKLGPYVPRYESSDMGPCNWSPWYPLLITGRSGPTNWIDAFLIGISGFSASYLRLPECSSVDMNVPWCTVPYMVNLLLQHLPTIVVQETGKYMKIWRCLQMLNVGFCQPKVIA